MLAVRYLAFMEVARQKSFSRAGEVLFISQPAISAHIKALEAHYGTKLFERQGINIALTEAGRLLYRRLLEVKQIQEETEFELTALHNREQTMGTLSLGASTTAALYILPKVMSAFHKTYPGVHISLLNRNSEIVLQALLDHEINIGITEEKGKLTSVTYQPFLKDQIIAVCSKDSPLAVKRQYSLREITGMPMAVRERGSGTLEVVKAALEKNRVTLDSLNIKVRLGGTEALKNFLLESGYLGFLSPRAITRELQQGELVALEFTGLRMERTFYFIQRKGEASELNRRFIKTARETYNLK